LVLELGLELVLDLVYVPASCRFTKVRIAFLPGSNASIFDLVQLMDLRLFVRLLVSLESRLTLSLGLVWNLWNFRFRISFDILLGSRC
jgi:hypothetical protein